MALFVFCRVLQMAPTVHPYLAKGNEPGQGGSGTLERALKTGLARPEKDRKCSACSSLLIAGTQRRRHSSLQGLLLRQAQQPRASQRRTAVDMQGFARAVAAAEATDRKGTRQAVPKRCQRLYRPKSKGVLADAGGAGRAFAQGGRKTVCERVALQIARGSAAAQVCCAFWAPGPLEQICVAGK